MASGGLQSLIEKAVSYQRASQYVNVASATLFLADYLQTEASEVALVWDRKWGLVKIIYAVSRYLPFVYLPLALYVGLQDRPTVPKCTASFATSSILIITGMMAAEAIMFLRAHALSGHNKRIAVWLALQFVGVHATIYSLFALFLRGTQFLPYQIGDIPGCIPYKFDATRLSIVFGIVVASETTIMLVTAYIAVRRYRNTRTPLLVVFYQDGVIYFVSLAAVTVGNIIFDLVGPRELRFMLAVPQGIMHSVLSCRMILHMYDFSRKEMATMQGTGTLSLQFAIHDGDSLKSATELNEISSSEKQPDVPSRE